MNEPVIAIATHALPEELPVFPLWGVLLLPRGILPLNVFEKRYKAMVDDALQTNRLIGMIQPRQDGATLFSTGCAGKITGFTETEDGRYEITLKGVCRFSVAGELPMNGSLYRRVRPDWAAHYRDTDPAGHLNLDRQKLKSLLKTYFDLQGMDCDWAAVDGASDDKLITCLAMICPLNAGEKQALLEAACCKTRADLFLTLLEMAVRDGRECPGGPCH